MDVQGLRALQAILPLTGYLFGCVCYREILMDINDRKGDAEAGIATVPVILGGMRALAVAAGCFLSSTFAGLKGLMDAKGVERIAQAVGAQPGVVRAALQLMLLAGALPALRDVYRMRRSNLDQHVVNAAIGKSFQPIACGLLVLSLV